MATAALYPEIPVPDHLRTASVKQAGLDEPTVTRPTLTPFVFLWARTVPCPNPQCVPVVPLYHQTWLRKKSSGYVALRPVPQPDRRRVEFTMVEASDPAGLGFDPGVPRLG